jgi:hypothetical protein
MTSARKDKFRRWERAGRTPRRAPISEKRAFGAWKTNRIKRDEKRAGLQRKGKVKRVATKNTHGFEVVYEVNKPLDILDDLVWRGSMAKRVNDFRRTKRGKVAFARLLLSLSTKITYATVELAEMEDGYAGKWFGSRESHSLESSQSVFHELCDRILDGVGDSRDGTVEELAIYTLTSRKK